MISSRLMEVKVLVTQLCATLGDPVDCSLPCLLCPWNSPGKNTGMDCHSLLQGIFTAQGLNLGLLHYRDSLPSEPQGKPKNPGVGSLSLLQQIFLTQKSNQDLLHFRQILYQLKYQVSPNKHF